MILSEKIEQDFKTALKNKDEKTVSILRMLKAALKNAEIDWRTKNSIQKANNENTTARIDKEMTDDDIVEIIFREVKKHKDSIDAFRQGGRQDLVSKEEEELKILEKYLPAQLTEEELKEIIKKAIGETGATGVKEMGKVIGLVMKESKGKAEGGLVSRIVKEMLGQ